MSVFRRSTSAGKTEEYHYRFMQGGKDYSGVCEGCKTKDAADAYEKKIKGKTKELSQQKNARALVENFRDDLTGGIQINLNDAYELSLDKPKRRTPSDELVKIKRSYWQDFSKFMAATFPDVTTLPNVRHTHAESYIKYLRDYGRFDTKVSYKRTGTKKTTRIFKGKLSAKTMNTYQQTLSEVFQLLSRDAGIIDNPFSEIPKLKNESARREAFTEDELSLIRDNLNEFVKPLFFIAIATALREGDICLLRWDEVDFKREIVNRRMNKTGNVVQIPIMPPLKNYLLELYKQTGDKGFVLPEHAAMYEGNRTGITYRIKSFLDGLGIQTSKKIKGRSRAVSVKDLHSCRHTFCYFAGIYGIPIAVVQDIVGHMTAEMTKHYSAHATIEAKRSKMELLPDFLTMNGEPVKMIGLEPNNAERAEIIELIGSLSGDAFQQVGKIIKKLATADTKTVKHIENILNLRG